MSHWALYIFQSCTGNLLSDNVVSINSLILPLFVKFVPNVILNFLLINKNCVIGMILQILIGMMVCRMCIQL